MAIDVLAAVRYLRQQGASMVSVIGGSAGGGAAAQASVDAGAPEIDRLVLLAPMAIETPEKMTGHKLFITAREDRNAAGLRLPGIQNQFEKAPGSEGVACYSKVLRMASSSSTRPRVNA